MSEGVKKALSWGKILGIAGALTVIFQIVKPIFNVGVDSVTFINTTQNTNQQLPKLTAKVDTLIMWRMIDRKSNDDLKEFIKDEFSRQRDANIQFRQGTINAVKEQGK